MPSATGKILLIRGGAIGDFILTLPVLAALREQFADIRLELLGYPRVTPLALAAGLVDHAQSIDARPMASFFAKAGPLPQELSDYFGSFALIISYLFDPDLIFQENVARCSKAQFIAGPHRPDELDALHATEAFLRPLQRLAIFDPDPVPRLRFPIQSAGPGAMLLPGGMASQSPLEEPVRSDPWLALHPGSGSERKNWAEARWSALLQRLVNETRWRFLLVGGEAEGERLGRLAQVIPPGRLHRAQNLPLVELAALLSQCSAYVGHDSGISHLAAALGLPGVILWGHTREAVWRPRSERMQVLNVPGGLASLRVDEVFAAVEILRA